MVGVLDVLAGFAKDNEATRKERLAERKELLAEKKDLLKQVALNKYAADEAIYQKNLGTWLNTEKELDMLKSSGTALNPKDLATKIATIEGRIPNNRQIEDEEMNQILSPYLANIKEYEDENGNKKFDYTGNLKPVAPSFDKYYNPDKYISAVDDMSKAVQGDWVRFVKGDEKSIAKEDKILATLQNDLEEGSSRANLDIRNYFGTPEKYTFDRKGDSTEKEVVLDESDLFQTLKNSLPTDDTQQREFSETPEGKIAPDGNAWTFNLNDYNAHVTDEKSSSEVNRITLSILQTLPDGEQNYISKLDNGERILKGDANVTRALIENAYKEMNGYRALQAMLNNDASFLNMTGVSNDLQKWFAENSVGLRNQSFLGKGQIAAMYIIPNPVMGHSDPVKTAEVKQDLQKLIQQDYNGVVAMFEEKGIAIPNTQPVDKTSSFSQWQTYLDAYSKGSLEYKVPFAPVNEEKAVELRQPMITGMAISTDVTQEKEINANTLGLFVIAPSNPEAGPQFKSWNEIHKTIEGSEDAMEVIFGGVNSANSEFKDSYESIKQLFNLTSSPVDVAANAAVDVTDVAAGAAPDVENQMSDMMKITFDNVESFLPPKKYRFRTSIAANYQPTEELKSWASETLPAWNNFIASLPKEKPAYMAEPDEEYKQKIKEFTQAEKYLKLNNKIQKYIS